LKKRQLFFSYIGESEYVQKPLQRSDKTIPLHDFSICQQQIFAHRAARIGVIVAPCVGAVEQKRDHSFINGMR
jgi:hypothetical protein